MSLCSLAASLYGTHEFYSSQKHLRWTMRGAPSSSYSDFLIHIGSNLCIEERMAPPSHALCFISAGESTSGSRLEGAKACTSFCIRACIPLNIVQPPASTMLRNKSFQMSFSHLMIAL